MPNLPTTDCPAARAIELVAHKWTVHILLALSASGAPTRFRELQRKVGGITQKELTKRLRMLESANLVARKVYAEVPPRVEYRLTRLGATLVPPILSLHDWAQSHGKAVAAGQDRSAIRNS
jgi:DNA-binding HxlR family transcriptional regulator